MITSEMIDKISNGDLDKKAARTFGKNGATADQAKATNIVSPWADTC